MMGAYCYACALQTQAHLFIAYPLKTIFAVESIYMHVEIHAWDQMVVMLNMVSVVHVAYLMDRMPGACD